MILGCFGSWEPYNDSYSNVDHGKLESLLSVIIETWKGTKQINHYG